MNRELIKELCDEAYESICKNDFSNALTLYNEVLTLDSNNDVALHFIAFLLNIQGKYRTALGMMLQAIERYKCNANYYTTLASIYRNLGKYPEAVEAIRTACELKPNDALALNNAAMILGDERRYDRAKDVFEAAIDLDPDNPFIRFNYSLLLLSMGDYENGWKEYEYRIPFHYGTPIPIYPSDLKNKNIQILPEQGYGDFIMFARYFRLLEEAGAAVYINCPKALDRLFPSRYCPSPDFSIRVASLASLFKEIPNTPYVKAPGKIKITCPHFKIGVATTGVKSVNTEIKVIKQNDGIKIIPHPANLAYFSSLKRSLPDDFFNEFPGKLYNLQIDVSNNMVNLNDIISDFADLADVIYQMDLVITIDTAVAHLAGAMGKKTWLLLPYDSEWRWQTQRLDSPWYPSIKIFRQPKRGDWVSVKEQVLAEIKDLT